MLKFIDRLHNTCDAVNEKPSYSSFLNVEKVNLLFHGNNKTPDLYLYTYIKYIL